MKRKCGRRTVYSLGLACALVAAAAVTAGLLALRRPQDCGDAIGDMPDDKTGRSASPRSVVASEYPSASSAIVAPASPSGSPAIIALAFSADSRVILASADTETVLVDAASGAPIRRYRTMSPDSHSYGITSAALSPDGTQFVTGSRDGAAILWSVSSGAKLRKFIVRSGEHPEIRSVSFSRAGTRLVTCAEDRGVIAAIWDVKTGARTAQLAYSSCRAFPYSAVFSSGGDQVILGMGDGTVIAWSPSDGKVRVLRGHASNQGVYCVAASPLEERAAEAGQDGRVIVWDLARGVKIRELEGRANAPSALTFSPNGKQILAAGLFSVDDEPIASGGNGTILWDVQSGKKTVLLDAPSSSVAFSVDGTVIATGANDGTITLWDAKSGRKIRTLPVEMGSAAVRR